MPDPNDLSTEQYIDILKAQLASVTKERDEANLAIREMCDLGPETCQLIDGWVGQEEWSSWDESVRGRLSKWILKNRKTT